MTTTAGHSFYILHRQPSWISDWNKKPKLFRGSSNDYSWTVWFQLFNCQNILLAQWFRRRSLKGEKTKFLLKTAELDEPILCMNDH
jgi:hypothetical protein